MNSLFNCLLYHCNKKQNKAENIQVIPTETTSYNQSIVTNQDNIIEQILSEFNKIQETKLALLFFAATAQDQVAQELLLRLHNSNQPFARIIFNINELKNPNFCTVNTDIAFLQQEQDRVSSLPQYEPISDEECLKKILERQSPKNLEFLKKSMPNLISLLADTSCPLQKQLSKLITTILNLKPENSPQHPHYSHGTHLSPAK